jgi:pilus assembly protein CpaC
MRRRFMPLFNGLIWATLLSGVPVTATVAATGDCAALGPMPAVLEVGEGQQQEVQSPVPITRIAVGDPKIADVRVNGNRAVLRQRAAPEHGVRPGPRHCRHDQRRTPTVR